MRFDIHWKARGAIKRFVGDITSDDIFASVIAVEGDDRFDRLYYVINDFSAIDGFSPGKTDVGEIAAIDKAASVTNPNILIAIIATDPQLIDISQQYIDSPFNAFPTRIFANCADAEIWLVDNLRSRLNLPRLRTLNELDL